MFKGDSQHKKYLVHLHQEVTCLCKAGHVQGVCACPAWELFVFAMVWNHAQPHLPRGFRCSRRSEHPLRNSWIFLVPPSPVTGSVHVSEVSDFIPIPRQSQDYFWSKLKRGCSSTSCLVQALGNICVGWGKWCSALPRDKLLFQPYTQFSIQPPVTHCVLHKRVSRFFCQSYKFPSSHFHQFLAVLSAARCYSPLMLLVQHCCPVLV